MSGSLLLIAVVWIVLLAPLLLRNQSPVRRTAKALTETRVLHQGGESLQRKKRLAPARESFRAPDADEELELVDAEPEFFLIDDDTSKPFSLKERAGLAGRGERKSATKADRDADAEVDSDIDSGIDADIDEVEAEVVADDASAEDVATPAETIDGDVVDEADSDTKAEDAKSGSFRSHDDTDTGPFAPIRLVANPDEKGTSVKVDADKAADPTGAFATAVSATDDAADDADAETEDKAAESAEQSEAAPAARRTRSISAAYFRGSDLDPEAEVDAAEVGVEKELEKSNEARTATAKNKAVPASLSAEYNSSDELDEADMQYLAARKGRGVYDPVASQAAAQRRLKRRKQVLMALLILCLVTVAAGVMWGGFAWVATVAAVGFTAFYLYVLRRSAIEDARTRQRRIARMRRARLGVRNTEDDELGVPSRLRRPGAVIVEADDADPEFDHLDYVDAADYFDVYDDADAYRDYEVADSRQHIHAV